MTSVNGIPGDGLTAGATGSARAGGKFGPDGQERHGTGSGRIGKALGGARDLAPVQPRSPGDGPAVGVGDASVMGAKNLAGGVRADLFARHTHAYVAGRAGQPIAILHAGCATASDLGTGQLDADVSVSLVEEDQPVTRAAVAARAGLSQAVLGDLRTVPFPPRAFDIVQCSSLLERMRNAELVLDRLIAAVKPGGLLLLRFCDRDSAAGFLERVLPAVFRRAIWRSRRPGEPGPYPAVFEPLVSERGLQSYALLRGLVTAERLALGGRAGGLPAGPVFFLATQRFVAWLSRGRLTAAHEELCYVLRKPENRFARIL